MHDTKRLFVPYLQPVRIGINLLGHSAPGADSRFAGAFREHGHGCVRFGRADIREMAGPGIINANLQRARRLPGQLFADRISEPCRRGDELPDCPFSGVDSVEPRLSGTDHVVLRIGRESFPPGSARYGIDASDRDLNRIGFPARGGKLEPERFALVDRIDIGLPIISTVEYP
jgi:hypothetical protein